MCLFSDGPTIETESGYVAEFVNPTNFADQIVVRDGIPGFPSESRLLRFDGTMLDIITLTVNSLAFSTLSSTVSNSMR
jgi:hypothetical protein